MNDTNSQSPVVLRREMLAGVALAGLSTFGTTEQLRADERREECHAVLRLSKDTTGSIRDYSCVPCTCESGNERQQIFKISFQYSGKIKGNKDCDDLAEQIPAGSLTEGSIKYILRQVKCDGKPHLVGTHVGDFRIIRSDKVVLFTGKLEGTHGVDPAADRGKRCCTPGGRGVLTGKGADRFGDCRIVASYVVDIAFDAGNPEKNKPEKVVIKTDGVMVCPC